MRFLLFFAILFGGFIGLQYYVFRRLSGIFQFTYTYKITIFLVFICANFFAIMMLSRRFSNIGIHLWYTGTMGYIGVIWMLFWLLLCYQVIQWIISIPPQISRYIVVIGGGMLILYGIFQAYHLTIKTVEIVSEKLQREVTIVQISDLHIGAINGKGLVDRVIAQIKNLYPDLVVVTGDLFDSTEHDVDDTLRGFNELTVPAFFVFGNHDQYAGKEQVREAISHTPIQILQNSVVLYDGTLQLVGLDYSEHQSQSTVTASLQQLALRDGYFTILLAHTPVVFRYIDSYPIDLMLSGHTHSGQLFPIFVIFKRFYPYLRGLYQSGTRYLYVSSGTGTWGPPMRLGTWSEVTLIRLVPQKNVAPK
jgi:predicted MPP superfamily phosphohydrolase